MLRTIVSKNSPLLSGCVKQCSQNLSTLQIIHDKRSEKQGSHQDTGQYDFKLANVPWPISESIYGEGWRSYGRLITPDYDQTKDLAIQTGKRTAINILLLGKALIQELPKYDKSKALALLEFKRQETSNYITSELNKATDVLFETIWRLHIKSKDTADFVKNGKVMEIVNQKMIIFRDKAKVTTENLLKNVKDKYSEVDKEALYEQLQTYKNRTTVYTVALVKNAKIPEGVYEMAKLLSAKIIESSKISKGVFEEKSKELSKVVTEKYKSASDILFVRLTQSQLNSMILHVKNYKFLDNLNENLKPLKEILLKFEFTKENQNYLRSDYVNRFFSRNPKLRFDSPLTPNVVKNDFNSLPPKQEFHSSAVQLYKPVMENFNFPKYLIYQKANGSLTVFDLMSDISGLIPEPAKKIWRGLRDKQLPSLQTTIASILQKIQDAIMKKK